MKKIALLLFALSFGLIMVSCTANKQADIVTTMFPQYDFAKQIVGDKMTVSLLIPPGAEIHHYEATSKDIQAIKNAKLFIFTSLEIDQWINDENSIGGANTIVLNLSNHYTLEDHDHDSHETSLSPIGEESDHDHDDEIHYWTDPTIAMQLMDVILEKVLEIDPEHTEIYTANAEAYHTLLNHLHHEIDDYLVGNQETYTIYFAGHNAMGLFGDRYHLNIVSLFEDFKPDADLTSAQLISFTNAIISAEIHFLFVEEMVIPKAAQTIQSELSKTSYALTLLELHGYHNVTKQDLEDGVTYAVLLNRNFENIQTALSSTP
ncbi:MAG: zinc ABC transporter substrate-binding protein [Acholeplasmataceae bacterium]|nr:zinc ABC transporter substrate-binding protein [Acholeplasmataceae bacterium]